MATMLDFTGKDVLMQLVDNNNGLDITFLPKGMYLLQLASDNKWVTKKIIKN